MNLFDKPKSKNNNVSIPLAEKMRPKDFSDFFGQSDLVSDGSILRKLISEDKVPSIIFWGPPGTGKTTLAKIIANKTGKKFITLSAVSSGVKDVRLVMEQAQKRIEKENRGTILFIDEIHRFNKAQQDAFLPFVESGVITLIGATTENPSFQVINALLSRCQVYILKSLTSDDLKGIVKRTLQDKENGLGHSEVTIDDDALNALVSLGDGDARYCINLLETACAFASQTNGKKIITEKVIAEATKAKFLRYDQSGDQHYNLISALHKAMRGSDVQASLYWLVRMLEAGEDPLYIVRRIIRFASEDIGNADPEALKLAVTAQQTVHFLGMPESGLAIAQAVVYMATAPKSNTIYSSYKNLQKVISKTGSLPVPLHIRNAPTSLMKELGYGKGYQYDHDKENGISKQEYLPDELIGRIFYNPKNIGFEREILKRMKYWEKLKKGE